MGIPPLLKFMNFMCQALSMYKAIHVPTHHRRQAPLSCFRDARIEAQKGWVIYRRQHRGPMIWTPKLHSSKPSFSLLSMLVLLGVFSLDYPRNPNSWNTASYCLAKPPTHPMHSLFLEQLFFLLVSLTSWPRTNCAPWLFLAFENYRKKTGKRL